MAKDKVSIKGLTEEEARQAQKKFGKNIITHKKQNTILSFLIGLFKEPMIVILLIASLVYFISGEFGDGLFLSIAIIFVAAISLFQDSRSRNAIKKLKELTQPKSKVIRNYSIIEIPSEEIVVGDLLLAEEGTLITADGEIIQSSDFYVNESLLTGESMSVYKTATSSNKSIYSGTTVDSGMAIAKITAIGNNTQLGKIGKSLQDIKDEKSPLEIQINSFVRKMVIAGVIVFFIVWGINYYNSSNFLDSLLKSLTLAMSILPEEIPVAFTTFMALGALRLMNMGVVVKQMKTVETLGSASVICADKTGTITENKMSLAKIFTLSTGKITQPEKNSSEKEKELIRMGMWASEPIPFDQMEKAIHETYKDIIAEDDRTKYSLDFKYPLTGNPPMMTHIFTNSLGDKIIATKGAPEALISVCNMSEQSRNEVYGILEQMANEGYRLLGVGISSIDDGKYPEKQVDLPIKFLGLLAFYDPPKENTKEVFEKFYKAGISMKIVTGDNPVTTSAIARQIDLQGWDKTITGKELMELDDTQLAKATQQFRIFSRMFPEAKLRIINSLKAQNNIVAMIGDGVNDGPALKAANIGIAMGQKGTEIARQASSLILTDDNLSKLIDAVALGRKIYANLKKAIQYIISIHIPIILTVFIPLALGWIYPNIFTPVHIIFLELIMGPTCSIIYENEPMEKNTMLQNPRPFTNTFFNGRELFTSVIQGLIITIGSLFVYQYAVSQGSGEATTRTMVFLVLIAANIFLTLVNRSFYYSIITTMKYKNNLVGIIIFVTSILTGIMVYFKPVAGFFEFEQIALNQLLISIAIGFISVIWFEAFKWIRRRNSPPAQ